MTSLHPYASLLAGKTAVITGAAMGLGKAMARVFVREGARVLAVDIDPAVERTAAEIGADCIPFRADVSREKQVRRITVPLHAYTSRDPEYALAVIQTFNDWLFDDFVSVDPNRLIGLAMVPVDHGMETAVAEMKRCLEKGARGFFIPAFPKISYFDSHYDPMWAAAAEADTPLCLHRTMGGVDPAGGFQFNVPGVNVAGTVSRFFSGVVPLTNLIFTGVFKRHPKLKIMDAEVNFGWVPFWKATMDQCFDQQKGWAKFPIDTPPSEALGKNVFVTVLDDQVGVDQVNDDPQLADLALFSIDYPHSVCLWPETAEHIERVTQNMDEESKAKILAGNALGLFGLG